MTRLFDTVVMIFELVGVAALVLGFFLSFVLAAVALVRGRGGVAAFHALRVSLGSTILLGLEIFVAADIIHTLSQPSLDEALVLGLIVVIRTVLSISIQIEIEGVLPWKRALFMSGGQVLAEQVAQAAAPSVPAEAPRAE